MSLPRTLRSYMARIPVKLAGNHDLTVDASERSKGGLVPDVAGVDAQSTIGRFQLFELAGDPGGVRGSCPTARARNPPATFRRHYHHTVVRRRGGPHGEEAFLPVRSESSLCAKEARSWTRRRAEIAAGEVNYRRTAARRAGRGCARPPGYHPISHNAQPCAVNTRSDNPTLSGGGVSRARRRSNGRLTSGRSKGPNAGLRCSVQPIREP